MIKMAMKKKHRPVLSFVTALALGTLLITGCGQKGLRRYEVSGTVKFRGQPVAAGYVSFEPNSAKGNRGPASGVTIQDGHYRLDANKGIVGGQYKVSIDGKDGIPVTIDGEFSKTGKFMFPTYKIEKEFSNEDTEWNIEIPSS
jgi:hypothetical protein